MILKTLSAALTQSSLNQILSFNVHVQNRSSVTESEIIDPTSAFFAKKTVIIIWKVNSIEIKKRESCPPNLIVLSKRVMNKDEKHNLDDAQNKKNY